MASSDNASTRTEILRESVAEDVKQIIVDYSSVGIEDIHDSSNPWQDLGWDSLDDVEIIMELEEHFDISIPDDFGAKIRTVGEIIDRLHDQIVNSPSE